MKILVAGGLGYIGSHTVVELINKGCDVIIADNLSNSGIEVLTNIEKITNIKPLFYQIDLKESNKAEEIFKEHNIDAIIHFAGYKAVGESVEKPLMYYENNLLTTINLANLAVKYNVKKLIFSSSATVYGDNKIPYVESLPLMETTNPYAETKAMCERILQDVVKANDNFSVVLLRYFNPIGAHKSGLLCEMPKGTPNNLMPFITEVARGNQEKLYVFGNDYDTEDGTAIRDYIHVLDLARGHILALENDKQGCNVYNLGTGKGSGVFEILKNFEKAHNITIPYEIIERRKGDLPASYANCEKAKTELGFITQYSLEDMCRDSFKK